MKRQLMGVKTGMLQIFDEKGNRVVCTLISTDKHVISQVKTQEKDGYEALQIAAFKVPASKARNVSKPVAGHFKKAGLEPRKYLCETKVASIAGCEVGAEYGVEEYEGVSFVDVTGISKGKGYQGVIKRHNFAGGPAAHGSGFHRHGGSCGMRTSPGRCLPGQKKAGHMGAEQVTVENLRVVKVDPERQCLLVEGAVPGARGGLVFVSQAKKKMGS